MVRTATRIPSLARIRSSRLRHVPLLRIDRIDLHLPASLKRGFDFLKQLPLLGVDEVLIQVLCSRNQKRFPALGFRIEFPPNQVSEAVGPIGISQEGIQGHADHRLIATMLTESLP